MASNYSFAVMPSVSISRSRFERPFQHKTSFNLGDIVPVYVDEVLPGDTRSIDMAALVRMSTPIAPIMDNIKLDFFAFFVPNRLVFSGWKQAMGENEASYGIPSTIPEIPGLNLTSLGNGVSPSDAYYKSLLSYLGAPYELFSTHEYGQSLSGDDTYWNVLAARGYYLIYNEWFRNQNIIPPVPIRTGIRSAGQYSSVISTNNWTWNGTTIAFNQGGDLLLPIMKASKLPDYFTKCLPYAQKGDAVTIPLSLTAPLQGLMNGSDPKLYSLTGKVSFAKENGADDGYLLSNPDGLLGLYDPEGTPTPDGLVTKTNLVADLSNVAGTIDQLRYAFQLQKFLWRDGAYGSRYWELLASHFGIKAPDASLQRPEFLGGHRMDINIDQVLSTAGYSNTSSTTVGAPGANSVTGKKMSLFTKSFTEHGYIFIMAVARCDQTYTQGINRMYQRRNRYDFYWPEFANLGSEAVMRKELIYFTGADQVFGYQEAWSSYRYKPSMATRLLNPAAPNSLSYWTLANDFDAGDSLDQSFIEQDRYGIARALVTSTTGPDFIGDFYFRDIAVRPMPTYSIPGFADHH